MSKASLSDPIKFLRVGIVGVNPERSWAKDSHVPALQKLPDLKLTAVATRSEKSARAAAEAFGIGSWYDNAFALVHSDDVDIVSVCVKVPEHRDIVLAAIAAGKHVLCEWPLGRNVEEATELATAAERSGVHTAIGLQGRASPAARRAHQMVADGVIGSPLSARIVSTTVGFAPQLPSAYAYFNDPASGANLSSILGGHTLDLASYVLGKINEIDALTSIQFKSIHLTDTDERIERLTADHLLMLSRHDNDCIVSIEVGGNRPPDTKFTFEIIGTAGRMLLTGGHPNGFQAGELRLEADRDFVEPDAPVVAGLTQEAANVAEVYAQLSRDIRASTWNVPDFKHAAHLTRLIDAVSFAASTGKRQQAHDWQW
ncbi:Gfo/Idh/MocA family protein [Nostoc sp.]|uniref:Gfo/Idh/MocA family protein n=1 Tax=Nostoc sp. TaxID=1180 RepID=UPI002FFAC47E